MIRTDQFGVTRVGVQQQFVHVGVKRGLFAVEFFCLQVAMCSRVAVDVISFEVGTLS